MTNGIVLLLWRRGAITIHYPLSTIHYPLSTIHYPLSLMPHPDAAFWLMIFWLFVIGGTVGSFLNVVVYRLPLGISLVHPPSHCPKCGKRIRWFDNVPIFGWIVLRGRCRQCHNPISVRYPVVEAITAAMFALVAAAELPYMCKMGVFGLYPYHMLLLCTLLCAGLIEYDGKRVPWKLFVPVLIVGTVAPLIWPELRPMPAWGELPAWLRAMVVVLPVIAVVPLLGMMWWRPRFQLGALACGLFCIYVCTDFRVAGASMGTAAACYSLLWPLGRFWSKLRILPIMVLWGCTLAWVLVWARLVSS
jgi:prepilin signal peptidase PulO-like enzyme (type II secretory pathway)